MIPLDITDADCRLPIGRCSAEDFLLVLADAELGLHSVRIAAIGLAAIRQYC
jgi:hypothetical protein